MQTKILYALIFEHTPNFNTLSLLTYLLFQFRFLLNILCQQQTILSKQVL